MSSPPALGVIVPCHDEAAVIERKLRNLARCAWPAPPAGRPHLLLVVDDGSDDDTAVRARALCAALFPAAGPVRARVLENAVRPGTSGAIEAGLRPLEGAVDLVVLTDAGVDLRPEALDRLAAEFTARPALGMACGAQEFVRDLHADGTCRGADGGELVAASDLLDRALERLRALESRGGRLFAVHGELLAWRADLHLQPAPGTAAEDLDLMFQARERGVRVERLPGVRFLHVRLREPEARSRTERRRARAFVQAVEGRASRPGAGLAERVQLWCYRRAPVAAPALVSGWIVPVLAAAAAGLLALARRAESDAALTALLLCLAALLALPVLALATRRGREIVGRLQMFREARRTAPGAGLRSWPDAAP